MKLPKGAIIQILVASHGLEPDEFIGKPFKSAPWIGNKKGVITKAEKDKRPDYMKIWVLLEEDLND